MAASDGARKEQAEWPPHPDRVFMALAAAWFETGEDPAEGEALRWLETLPPPAIAASDHTTRSSIVSYVPVNDDNSPIDKKGQSDPKFWKARTEGFLPIGRNRQPRGFPVAIPHDPTVYFIWQAERLDTHRDGLESLAAKVTRIGHSASLVQAWVTDNDEDIPAPTCEPTEDVVAIQHLRVFPVGRLDALVRQYNQAEIEAYVNLKTQYDDLPSISKIKGKGSAGRKRKKTQLKNMIIERFGSGAERANIVDSLNQRPTPTLWQRYKKPSDPEPPDVPSSVFAPNLVVLTIKGRRIPLTTTLRLTQALRGALMDSCLEQPPPEWFSGHTPQGSPTTSPHMALLTLPFVGRQHADGRVMGLALALPESLPPQEAARCLYAFLYEQDTGLPRKHKLFDGRWFECEVEIEISDRPRFNLNPDTWTRPSRVWASVTPVVLNRHFEGSDRWERAAESVKDACEHIELPRPREVLLHPTSLFEGVPLSREFPRLPRKRDGGLQRHTHAVMIFDEPVQGPVVLGAGRFRGYGLCRPMGQRGDRRD